MSAEDCPFFIIRHENVDDESKKQDRFIKFEVPIDPNDADGLKSSIQFHKLNSDDPEDVLLFFRNFNKLVEDTDTAEGEPIFRLFNLVLGPDAQTDWATVLEDIGDGRDQDDFVEACELFLAQKVDRDCAINTKEWLNQVKKPRSMTVKKFFQRIKQINNLFAVMPLPEEGAIEDDRVEGFSEAELRNILKKASPRGWRDTQEKSNIRFNSTAAQVQYYEKLRNIDERRGNGSGNKQDNNSNRKSNGSKKKYGKKNNGNSGGQVNDSNAPCPIHGGSHTIGQCKVIQAERNKYKNKGNGRNNESNGNNNRGSGGNSNNSQRNNNSQRYNNNRQRSEYNNIETSTYVRGGNNNNASDSEDNYAIEEELHMLDEDVVDEDIQKAAANLKSTGLSDEEHTSTPVSKGSDIRVLLQSKGSPAKKSTTVLGLLDTGATANFVSRATLKFVEHTLETANSRVNARYSSINVKEKATFLVRLPEFASSKAILVTALVEERNTGRHNIIFGTPFLNELGLQFDYNRGTIVWDDVSTSMKTIAPEEINILNDEDPGDTALPDFMKKTLRKAAALPSYKANTYDKYNYRDMVLRCTHLSSHQQNMLLELFSQYEELFSGKLGSVPGKPVSLKLKSNAKPFASRAYTVPKALEHIAKKEVYDLVDIGVLVEGISTEWVSPSFFRPKKDGKVRFVSDLRKLNACLERHPFPLPLVDEVIWKMNGFTFATCLDLNRGYYHFVLDEKSRKLCGIILPWGTYAYARLPQGLMPSSDIFQGRMMQLFRAFEDVIVYIDNILLFTKSSFAHHLQRLQAVLEVLHTNNLHVHVEETFLASDKVDYLGYTLTTKGIKPQLKKILPILRFSKPNTVKQLRGFLGLVNYYKKLVHRRSHILEPLTRISSSKSKFLKGWGPEQDQAFSKIKSLMARQVLLHYPDFSQPFDVYTDASNYQLGGVIVQDGFPVAFYSRKLNSAQRNYTTMEKELLSIVETAVHHRSILYGFLVNFHSDHKNLSFENFSSERVRRWRLLLEEFKYTFKYTPGKDNTVADMLSRYPIINVTEQAVHDMNNIDEDDEFPIDFNVISNHQSNDYNLNAAVRAERTRKIYDIKFINNIKLIFFKNKVVLPESLVRSVVAWYHDNLNHPGINRTFETINMHFTCKGLQRLVQEHVSSCTICAKQKRSNKVYGALPPSRANYKPWECVHIDLFGPWTFECSAGKTHQLRAVSIIDSGLRWIELHEYSSKSSEDISFIFDREWLYRYPRPRMVVFDNGTEFSTEFHELLQSYGIKAKATTVKNPQSNAIVERVHLTIGDSLRAMDLSSRPHDDTSNHGILQSVAWALRTTYHTSLRTSPGQLAFGQDMVVPATYLANWRHIHERRNKNILYNNARENRNRIEHDYKVGDYVYILTKDIQRKLAPTKQGPFRIVTIHTNATVTIRRSARVTERLNIRHLFPAHVN